MGFEVCKRHNTAANWIQPLVLAGVLSNLFNCVHTKQPLRH
jgi:hypothetical protein